MEYCFLGQLLGFEVDDINTVQFCNHTGHKVFKGQVLNANDIKNLIDGLRENGLLNGYTHILSGYNGSLSSLGQLLEVVKEIRSINQDVTFVCDPVMGDAGHMYVPQELLPFYRDHVIRAADVLTPNQYEAELLTGISIRDEETAFIAIEALHRLGIKTVVISSSEFGDEKEITCFGSQALSSGGRNRIKVVIPKIDGRFVGTGDLTTALLMAWLHRTNNDLAASCSKTMSSLKCVLDRTFKSAQESGQGLNAKTLELKLIQSKKDIEDPPDLIRAETIL